MRFKSLVAPCVLLALVAVAVPAAAQDAQKTTVSASYSFLNDRDLEENFPVGWLVAASHRVSSGIGIVGEMGGNYLMDFEGTEVDFKVHGFLAGIRFMGSGANVTPFAQVLAGVANRSVSVPGTDDSDSVNDFALQPGVGVDVFFSPRVGLRLQGDYRWIKDDPENSSEYRFAVGLVFAIGG